MLSSRAVDNYYIILNDYKEAVYDRTMQTSMDGSMMKFDNK